MSSVAFFRNLNQGQRGHPSTQLLLEAFAVSGARGARGVRGNGTVVFDADDPEGCLAGILAHLHALCDWQDVAFVRDLAWAADRADELVVHGDELSVFDGPPPAVPLAGRGCTVVAAGPGYAITANDLPRTSQATPTLERALGVPVTSRGASTIALVAARA